MTFSIFFSKFLILVFTNMTIKGVISCNLHETSRLYYKMHAKLNKLYIAGRAGLCKQSCEHFNASCT